MERNNRITIRVNDDELEYIRCLADNNAMSMTDILLHEVRRLMAQDRGDYGEA